MERARSWGTETAVVIGPLAIDDEGLMSFQTVAGFFEITERLGALAQAQRFG